MADAKKRQVSRQTCFRYNRIVATAPHKLPFQGVSAFFQLSQIVIIMGKTMKITFEVREMATAPKDRNIMLLCVHHELTFWQYGKWCGSENNKKGNSYWSYHCHSGFFSKQNPPIGWAEFDDMAGEFALNLLDSRSN